MSSQYEKDLTAAVEHLVVLTAIKLRIASLDADSFAQGLRTAVPDVLLEQSTTAAAIGLMYRVRMYRWELQGKVCLPNIYELEAAATAWTSMRKFAMSCRHDFIVDVLGRSTWPDFRSAYLAVVVDSGKDVERFRKRIDDWYDASSTKRVLVRQRAQAAERRSETKNRTAMAADDGRAMGARRRLSAEERVEHILHRWRRWEQRCCRQA